MTMKEFLETLTDEQKSLLLHFLNGQVEALKVMTRGDENFDELRFAVYNLVWKLEEADEEK